MKPAPFHPEAIRDWDFRRVLRGLRRSGRITGDFDPDRITIICEIASERFRREIVEPDEISDQELAELASYVGAWTKEQQG